MTCTTDNSITIYQGESKTLQLTISDDDGDPVNITGGTVYMTVRSDVKSVTNLIAKSSPSDGITIVDAANGRADITIDPDDTLPGLTPKAYKFDVWLQTAGGDRYVVIEPANFVVKDPVSELP